METMVERGCGLDVHQASVVACVLVGGPREQIKKQVRTFETTTRSLLELAQWMVDNRCTHVAMEGTGIYWKPVEAAQAAVRKKDSYLRAKFHRLKARRGYKRAAMAIAHKILIAAYHVLRDATVYRDLGPSYLDHLDERGVVRGLVGRLKRLGYSVDLNKGPAPA
jgi:hypothetical protein